MLKLAPITFGALLIIIWAVLTIKPTKPENPTDLTSLQDNLIMAIEGTSVRTALLTAGLVSIAFGLT